MWPWNGITGAPTSADGSRRRAGRVTVCQRAGATTARAGLPGLPGRRQRRLPHGIRLRRCAIRLTCLARGDTNHDHETQSCKDARSRRGSRRFAQRGRPDAAMSVATSARKTVKERVAALAKAPLAVCESDKDLQAMLNVLRNKDEPVEVRLAALQSLAGGELQRRRVRIVPQRLHRDLARGRGGSGSGAPSARARHARAREGRLRAEETARRVEESGKGVGPAREGAATPQLRRARGSVFGGA